MDLKLKLDKQIKQIRIINILYFYKYITLKTNTNFKQKKSSWTNFPSNLPMYTVWWLYVDDIFVF
jgi:hypothetical protein